MHLQRCRDNSQASDGTTRPVARQGARSGPSGSKSPSSRTETAPKRGRSGGRAHAAASRSVLRPSLDLPIEDADVEAAEYYGEDQHQDRLCGGEAEIEHLEAGALDIDRDEVG